MVGSIECRGSQQDGNAPAVLNMVIKNDALAEVGQVVQITPANAIKLTKIAWTVGWDNEHRHNV